MMPLWSSFQADVFYQVIVLVTAFLGVVSSSLLSWLRA
jgi:hypothetical protein